MKVELAFLLSLSLSFLWNFLIPLHYTHPCNLLCNFQTNFFLFRFFIDMYTISCWMHSCENKQPAFEASRSIFQSISLSFCIALTHYRIGNDFNLLRIFHIFFHCIREMSKIEARVIAKCLMIHFMFELQFRCHLKRPEKESRRRRRSDKKVLFDILVILVCVCVCLCPLII